MYVKMPSMPKTQMTAKYVYSGFAKTCLKFFNQGHHAWTHWTVVKIFGFEPCDMLKNTLMFVDLVVTACGLHYIL